MRLLRYAAVVAVISAVPLAPAAAAGKKIAVAQNTDAKNERSDQVLKDAIAELQAVKNRVHGAAQIYGGHRGKADQHIDQAIAELQAALKYDESRERAEKK